MTDSTISDNGVSDAPPDTTMLLNGGYYPQEDGTWRVVCWVTNIHGEKNARAVSNWLGTAIQNSLPPGIAPEGAVPS